jgi:hypothetical protein
VAPDDRVRPRSVHHVHLAEDLHGQGDLLEVPSRGAATPALSVTQELDPRRRRRDALGEDRLPEERVQDGALAGVELPDHDEQEEVVELGDRARERLLVLVPGPGADEHHPQLTQPLAELLEEFPTRLVEDAAEHGRARPVAAGCGGF